MEFGFAFMANAAEVGQDGRFYALGGGIDGIAVDALPASIPAMAIVVQLRFRPEECGVEHRLRMTISRPDGQGSGLETFINFVPSLPGGVLP